jgi:hypothetical protein
MVSEQRALNVGPSSIERAYEHLGSTDAPPVLLITGAGSQLINWPDGFCAKLVEQGTQVVRFDNRDSGLSSHFPQAPVPDLRAALAGDFSSVSYTLSDTVALLDVLGFDSTHIVGASLAGWSHRRSRPRSSRSLLAWLSVRKNLGNEVVTLCASCFGLLDCSHTASAGS